MTEPKTDWAGLEADAKKKKRLSPQSALRQECRYCMGTGALKGKYGCANDSCKIWQEDLGSSLKRIKLHCRDCVGENVLNAVKACDGRVITPYPHICPLLPYRFGKSPDRTKREVTPKERARLAEMREKAFKARKGGQ